MEPSTQRAAQERDWTCRVSPNLFVSNVNVDGLSPSHSLTIQCGDAILWYSGLGKPFTISEMVRKQGNGPAQPFEKHFPNPDPPSDQVYSGRSVPTTGKTHYKYTVHFADGQKIDPTVIIQQ